MQEINMSRVISLSLHQGQLAMDRFEEMRTFAAVVGAGSFVRAAEAP
jgi:hypothetical protein